MNAEFSRLIGATITSPLFDAVREGLYKYFDNGWLRTLRDRLIKAGSFDNLSRRDKMIIEQARKSYLILKEMGLGLQVHPPKDKLRTMIRIMIERGLLPVQGEDVFDVPLDINDKYPNYLFYKDFDDWRKIGTMGRQILVQVGEDSDGEPVVIVSDAPDVESTTFGLNTPVYTIDQLMTLP
jgi:hypothetical protein